MGKYELAETALHKASDLDPKSAFVWNNLGLVAFERGHDQEAFLDFQKASELDPKYVQARLNKAVVYLDCGDYKHARAELERGSKSTNDAGPRWPWAWPRAATGVRPGANLRRALDISPTTPGPLRPRRVLYMDFDRTPKAKDFPPVRRSGGKNDAKRGTSNRTAQELR
jgi:tetratricopeptide (TPR) repeat protein